MSGKNSAMATRDLMMKIPEVSPIVVTLASVSWAKLSNEEYMVTKGPTNHLDLLMRLDIVIAELASKNQLHFANPSL